MEQTTHQIRCEQWTRLINECLASGKSKTTWCKENNVFIKRFFYWQRILRNEACSHQKLIPSAITNAQPPVAFVELKPSVHEPNRQDMFHPALIIHHNGTTLEISNSASMEFNVFGHLYPGESRGSSAAFPCATLPSAEGSSQKRDLDPH